MKADQIRRYAAELGEDWLLREGYSETDLLMSTIEAALNRLDGLIAEADDFDPDDYAAMERSTAGKALAEMARGREWDSEALILAIYAIRVLEGN